MYDLHRRIDASQLPGGRTVIKFLFRGLPKFGHWWIVLENGTRELCVDNPGKAVDVHLTTDLRTMTHIWGGDMEIRTAKKTGHLQLTGDPTLIQSISDWLRPGVFAHVRPYAESLIRNVRRERKNGIRPNAQSSDSHLP
jgi:hypothetical protein